MIPFTRRELTRAWHSAWRASQIHPRSNAHRLLLFYAIECGLKATYLKRENLDPLDARTATPLKHDLNRILDKVNAPNVLRLPSRLTLPALKRPLPIPRDCNVGDLNQIWRYGGELESPTDAEIEHYLEAIHTWIAKELQ